MAAPAKDVASGSMDRDSTANIMDIVLVARNRPRRTPLLLPPAANPQMAAISDDAFALHARTARIAAPARESEYRARRRVT
jgi:hypothetical protein